MYQSGLHLICDCLSEETTQLSNHKACQILLNQLIESEGLSKIGEVYHNFQVVLREWFVLQNHIFPFIHGLNLGV